MWFFILAIIAVIVGAAFVTAQRSKKLFEEGKIIKRPSTFWENAELFITNTTLESFENAIQKFDLTDCKVSIEHFSNGILFKSSHSWNATVEFKGTKEDKNVFEFSFPAYKTKNGMPYRVDTMNIIETAVEKAFLSNDPETAVETHKMQYKTKSKLF